MCPPGSGVSSVAGDDDRALSVTGDVVDGHVRSGASVASSGAVSVTDVAGHVCSASGPGSPRRALRAAAAAAIAIGAGPGRLVFAPAEAASPQDERVHADREPERDLASRGARPGAARRRRGERRARRSRRAWRDGAASSGRTSAEPPRRRGAAVEREHRWLSAQTGDGGLAQAEVSGHVVTVAPKADAAVIALAAPGDAGQRFERQLEA